MWDKHVPATYAWNPPLIDSPIISWTGEYLKWHTPSWTVRKHPSIDILLMWISNHITKRPLHSRSHPSQSLLAHMYTHPSPLNLFLDYFKPSHTPGYTADGGQYHTTNPHTHQDTQQMVVTTIQRALTHTWIHSRWWSLPYNEPSHTPGYTA